MPKIRLATCQDIEVLNRLIAESVRGLSQEEYSLDEIEGGLQDVFGVDTQLIADETYYILENDQDIIVACGGWSKRKTLYGGNQFTERNDEQLLTPQMDSAKIRAFFVRPEYARHGYGRMLLKHCEEQALSAGFSSFEMMATLPGVKLYEKCGYIKDHETHRYLSNGSTLGFFKMKKNSTVRENQSSQSMALK